MQLGISKLALVAAPPSPTNPPAVVVTVWAIRPDESSSIIPARMMLEFGTSLKVLIGVPPGQRFLKVTPTGIKPTAGVLNGGWCCSRASQGENWDSAPERATGAESMLVA